MPLPAAYSESTLATYVHGQVSEMAAVLGWTVAAGSYAEAVNDALLAYGTTDIASITSTAGLALLRALVIVAALRRIQRAVAADYDLTADNQTFRRSQVAVAVRAALADAERAVLTLAGGPYGLATLTMTDQEDPYRHRTAAEFAA